MGSELTRTRHNLLTARAQYETGERMTAKYCGWVWVHREQYLSTLLWIAERCAKNRPWLIAYVASPFYCLLFCIKLNKSTLPMFWRSSCLTNQPALKKLLKTEHGFCVISRPLQYQKAHDTTHAGKLRFELDQKVLRHSYGFIRDPLHFVVNSN